MKHLEESPNKFPEIPRSADQLGKVIELKLALSVEGIRIEESALEGVGTIYQENLHDWFDWDHCKAAPKVPNEIVLPQRTAVEIRQNQTSPFALTREDGQLLVKKGTGVIMEVSYLPRPPFYDKKTSSGVEMWRIMRAAGLDRLFYSWSGYCYYEGHGGVCHFCSLNSAYKKYGNRLPYQNKLSELKEVFAEAIKDPRYVHIGASGGSLPEGEELKLLVYSIEVFREVLGLERGARLPFHINIDAPARYDTIETWYKEGVAGASLNLELWHPAYFHAVCPGKDTVPGRDKWLQALKWAVEIFGKGPVSCNFVAGIEPMEYTVEGMEYCCSIGVWPLYSVWSPMVGSKFAGHRPPNIDWYLELNEKHVDLLFKYGFASHELMDHHEKRAGCLICRRCNGPFMGQDEEIMRRKLQDDPNFRGWREPQPLNTLGATALSDITSC